MPFEQAEGEDDLDRAGERLGGCPAPPDRAGAGRLPDGIEAGGGGGGAGKGEGGAHDGEGALAAAGTVELACHRVTPVRRRAICLARAFGAGAGRRLFPRGLPPPA